MLIERASENRLGREQPELRRGVMPEHKLRESCAQSTIAIEDDDRAIVGKSRNSGIVAIAIGRARDSAHDFARSMASAIIPRASSASPQPITLTHFPGSRSL